MDIVFLSNFFNHHQKPVSDAFDKATNGNYLFVETASMPAEQHLLGYGKYDVPYVVRYSSENSEIINKRIMDADAVIYGEAPLALVRKRLKTGKLTFRDDERRYKSIIKYLKYPIYTYNSFFLNKGYLLCSSAFGSRDYRLSGMSASKCFKWGYFTEVKEYEDIDSLIYSKPGNSGKKPVSILWACRMIGWKHPERAIEVAKRLKEDGIPFSLSMIGRGPLEEKLKKLTRVFNLESEVSFLGSMPPEKVREHMEMSDIFLATSDQNEGWGATVNESMNSACAVVADSMIGSVPYLIENGANGLIYPSGSIDRLYELVRRLAVDPGERIKLGRNAYSTMTQQWNASQACHNFIELVRSLSDGVKNPILYGPCSAAPVMHHNWFK